MLSNNEKYIFTSELALAISNGLQVEDGLKMLVGFDADVSICAKKLEDIMKQGYSFTDALKESKEFDEYMIQMVVVGQSIGNLDVVFKELSTYYARQKELNYQIQDAITYPFVLILMMFVIVATLIFKVFPIFENILSQMSMSLSLMHTARILSYISPPIKAIFLVCAVNGSTDSLFSSNTTERSAIRSEALRTSGALSILAALSGLQ